MGFFEDLISSLSGNQYNVKPLQPFQDPTMSDWDITAEKWARDEKIRRLRLGLDPERQGGTIGDLSPEDDPVKKYLSDLSSGAESAPGIGVDQLQRASRSPGDEQGISEQVSAPSPSAYPDPYEYDPKEYLRDYASNMDADKLRKIKEQAFIKGKAGDLSASVDGERPYGPQGQFRGGSFSQQEMSPELAQRYAERDQFISDQDMRDARWDRDLARQRRDPEGKASAESQILKLRDSKAQEKEQLFQQSIVAGMVGAGGKIPRDKAAILLQAGIPITGYAIGSDPAAIDSSLAYEVETAQKMLANINPLDAVENPNLQKAVDMAQFSLILAQGMRENIRKGMDPDEATKLFRDQMTQKAAQLGLESAQNFYTQQSGPTQTIAGE